MDTSDYLRGLSDLGRRHGFGISGNPQIFVLEADDRNFDYSDNADGVVTLGAQPDPKPFTPEPENAEDRAAAKAKAKAMSDKCSVPEDD